MPKDIDKSYNDLFGILVAFFAIIAFSIQQILNFIDPGLFIVSSGLLALGALVLNRMLLGSKALFDRILICSGVIGSLLLTYTIIEGIMFAERNDTRCLKIEMDMLSAAPKMANGPDVFQALKCRPQTANDAEALMSNADTKPPLKFKAESIETTKSAGDKPKPQIARPKSSATPHPKS